MKPRYAPNGEQLYICGLCADTGVVWWPPYTAQPGRAVTCPDCGEIRRAFDYNLARYKLWLKREKHPSNAGMAQGFLMSNPHRERILATLETERSFVAVQLSIF